MPKGVKHLCGSRDGRAGGVESALLPALQAPLTAIVKQV